MKKVYVLDTNVLLQDPFSIYSFEENEVVIPAVVLEEVDSKKRYMDEVGRNARQVSRIIDSLRERGSIHQNISLDSGGTLRVELNHRSFQRLQETFAEKTNDNRIIAVALNLQCEERENDGRNVVLVSKDALVRVKADALGIEAEDFLSDRVVEFDSIYKGYKECYVNEDQLGALFSNKHLPVNKITNEKVCPHQYFILKSHSNSSVSAVGKVSQDGRSISPCNFEHDQVWGIRPRNVQQKMALDLLMKPDIHLVTLVGKAGTGKTLLALAAGLMQTEDFKYYKKLFIARPIMPVGKDIGYLPGEKEEKLKPWLQPIYDNLEFLFDTKKPGEIEQILAGIASIQVEALTYIRGRSIPKQLIIIDEAQNLTKHEVKTILTRVGEGSKIVLMGDPQQIDHPYLDEYNNGLTYVVEMFKNESVSGHVKLQKGERSLLARIAADLL